MDPSELTLAKKKKKKKGLARHLVIESTKGTANISSYCQTLQEEACAPKGQAIQSRIWMAGAWILQTR